MIEFYSILFMIVEDYIRLKFIESDLNSYKGLQTFNLILNLY